MSVKIADLVAPGIAAIRPYEPGKPIEEVERELGVSNVVKLASNENPLGPSPRALEAMRKVLLETHRYPDGACFHLKRRLAAHVGGGVTAAEIAIGNGSNEILDLLVRTFCDTGDEVLAPERTFVCYQLAAQARGIGYREVERGPDFAYDLDALAAAVGPRTRVVFLANPDNPTGVYAGEAALRKLVRDLPPQVILAVDEAYREYARAGDYPDVTRLRGERQLLVVMRTFSKIYGLAGTRCGYGVAPAELVGFLDRVRNPFNVSAVAQAAATAALDDKEHVERSRRSNAAAMELVTAGLTRLGARFVPSQANFVLVDVAPRDGREVFAALLARGVIVRPLGGYRLPRHLRVTLGTDDENHRFLEAMAAVLGSSTASL